MDDTMKQAFVHHNYSNFTLASTLLCWDILYNTSWSKNRRRNLPWRYTNFRQYVPIQAFGWLSGPDVKWKRSSRIFIRADACEAHIAKRFCDKWETMWMSFPSESCFETTKQRYVSLKKIEAPTILNFYQTHSDICYSWARRHVRRHMRMSFVASFILRSIYCRMFRESWHKFGLDIIIFFNNTSPWRNISPIWSTLNKTFDSFIIFRSFLRSSSSVADLTNESLQASPSQRITLV